MSVVNNLQKMASVVSYCEGKHLNVLLFDRISVTLLGLSTTISVVGLMQKYRQIGKNMDDIA